MPKYYNHEISGQVAALIQRYNACEDEVQKIRAVMHRLVPQVNEAWAKDKPEFPTPGHRDGITEAIRRIRENVLSKDQHGDKCDYDGWVNVDTSRCWMSVEHKSPLGFQAGGRRLWSFTDEDLESFRSIIRDNGASVTDEWQHDNGVSFILYVSPV
jgi:hypothetical protein